MGFPFPRLAEWLFTIYLRFGTASAVVPTPLSPKTAAQVSLRIDRFVSGNGSFTRWLQGFLILARRNDSVSTAGGNRIMAFKGVVSPNGSQ